MMVTEASDGDGRTMVIVGDAGIGKTSLLDAIPALVPAGSVVLRVGVAECESLLPYAAAIDLVGPLLEVSDVADGIGGAARECLDRLLAARPGAAGPMPICRAVLGALLAASSGGRLVVLIVDDAQWLDQSSAEIIAYVAKRVRAERMLIVVALRTGGTSPLLGLDDAPLLLGGLSRRELGPLLLRHGMNGVVDEVSDHLHHATGGNPLAILEIAENLGADERSAQAELPLFPPVGAAIREAFGRRLADLGADVQEALVVAAAHGPGHTAVLFAALRELGLDQDVLNPAVASGVIETSYVSVRFTHPLLRLVAYSGASPTGRRRAHGALASAWQSDQPARGAWHLAESVAAPNESIAAAIESVAHESAGQFAMVTAGELYERSSDLSIDATGRDRRRMAAARAFGNAGKASRAAQLLRNVLEVTNDPTIRADAAAMHGTFVAFSSSPLEAADMLCTEADRIAPVDSQRAVTLLAVAFSAAILAFDMDLGERIANRATQLADGGGPVVVLVANTLRMQSALMRGRTDEATSLLGPLAQFADVLAAGGVAEADHLLQSVALAYMVLDRWEEAAATVGAVVRRGRAAGRDGSLAFAYAVGSESALRLGRWADAHVDARRAGDCYADPADRDWATLSSLALCSRVEAHLGLAEPCRAHADTVIDGAGNIGSVILVIWARHALALLALGVGDHGEAIRQLENIATVVSRSGEHDPGYLWWKADLIEAYWRSGRISEALAVRSSLDATAERSGRVSAQMLTARADALLGPSERAEAAFSRSVTLGEQIGAPFEVARTRMLLAEWRTGAGVDGSEPLQHALVAFERLGASAWESRCLSLGDASTASPSSGSVSSPTALLTERELETALLVSRGRTNREIADELFLSPKTIENTLAKVYRKLDVRSRTELAILFAARP